MRIALAQINCTVGDLDGNQQKILEFISKAKKQKADLVAFPELAVCGYPPEDLLYKDYFVQDNIKTLKTIARKVTGIAVIVGFVDSKNNALYNAAAILKNGKVSGVYYKQELPNYGVFDEKRYFITGKTNKVFKTNSMSFAVNICEDIWLNSDICKKQANAGAKAIINISSSPYHVGKFSLRQDVIKNQAKASKVFMCYVNLIGGQDELVFDGGSIIMDPDGKLIAAGKQFEEDLIVADIGKRKTDAQPIDARSIQRLKPNEEIYQALVLGTRDYVYKNGFKKVIIGLSGGIDSALVAMVACDALGKKNVICISMPSDFSSSGTQFDAKELAENLGVEHRVIPITPIFQSYLEVLHKSFEGTKPNVAEENIQARIRGNILMAFSNKFGWLVLATGNKSEVAVGYCTLYGDMSGGFAVISDVLKTQVYEITKFRNDLEGGKLVPKTIFKRPPTAELRENQKDQDSLPPYNKLDPLLSAYVEQHKSFTQMKGINQNQNLIKDVIKKVDKSEYKRRQAPPGIKITSRAFGKDWRLPITNKYKSY